MSRPRLLTTLFFFLAIYLWFNFGATTVWIPDDSFALVEDERLADILNATLGVCMECSLVMSIFKPYILDSARTLKHFRVLLIYVS
jgi:hypothetical protein